ncbi:MAG TPA: S9 family peptidase, partial [Clostridiales bacterium]|nr:S9 family peptidase [Clostridiales bacterium]
MEKIKLKDFLDFKFLSGIELSPDKKHAAFAAHTCDYNENRYISNIWIYDRLSEEYRKLTNMGKEKSFIWLDNDTILFPSLREEKLKKKIDDGENWTVFYAINIHGGEAYEYMRIPMNVNEFKLIANEKFLITAEYNHYGINLHSIKSEDKEEAISMIKENKDYEILDEIPFWSNGEGFTNKKRIRLYLYDKGTKDIIPISGKFENVSLSSVKDGKALYTAFRFTNKMELTNELY